eukprot:3907128-Prymnesium_polylepis.1
MQRTDAPNVVRRASSALVRGGVTLPCVAAGGAEGVVSDGPNAMCGRPDHRVGGSPQRLHGGDGKEPWMDGWDRPRTVYPGDNGGEGVKHTPPARHHRSYLRISRPRPSSRASAKRARNDAPIATKSGSHARPV